MSIPTQDNGISSDSVISPNCIVFDQFTLDIEARRLLKDDKVIQLPSRAFDVLAYLIANRERSVHRNEIIEAIWNDVVVTDDSLINAISVSRRALGDEPHNARYIETIPRRGYRFIGKVKTIESSANKLTESQPTNSSQPPTSEAENAKAISHPLNLFNAPSLRLLMMAVTSVTALLLIAFLFLKNTPTLPEAETNTSVRLFQPPPSGTSFVSSGVLSPNGRYLAFVARNNTNNKTTLWTRSLQSGDTRLLEGTDGAAKPFWSPDSRSLGFFSKGELLTIQLNTETLQLITPVVGAAGATWGENDMILFAEWTTGLFLVPASGDGDVETIATLDRNASDVSFAWPQFFPGSNRYIYQIISQDPDRMGIHVGSLDTLETYRFLDTTSPATLAPPQHILHVQKDLLVAEEFDPYSLELTGRAIVVARGISEPSFAAENIVSVSGNLLAFEQGVTQQKLTWFNRGGEQLSILSMPTVLYNPRISPDGSSLLATSSITNNPGLWLASLDREEYARLEIDAVAPVWSTDGQFIAFTSRTGFDIQIQSLNKEGEPRILFHDDTVKILNDWSPDGESLIYTKQGEFTGLDLWTVQVEDGIAQPLIATPYSETQARISPDGKWIAYSSNETGALEVYVARYPELDNKQKISNTGGGQPQWHRDQSELFFLSQDRAIMAVSVSGDDLLHFGSAQKLFHPSIAGNPGDARDYYAVDASGNQFLIDDAINKNNDQAITVIVNWGEGLRESSLAAQLP